MPKLSIFIIEYPSHLTSCAQVGHRNIEWQYLGGLRLPLLLNKHDFIFAAVLFPSWLCQGKNHRRAFAPDRFCLKSQYILLKRMFCFVLHRDMMAPFIQTPYLFFCVQLILTLQSQQLAVMFRDLLTCIYL